MKGLWNKYMVTKTSGKPLAIGFDVIVLRIDDGQYVDACREGVKAFADAVKDDNPVLAHDIYIKLDSYRNAVYRLSDIVYICYGGCGRTTEGMTIETCSGEFEMDTETDPTEAMTKWTCENCYSQ